MSAPPVYGPPQGQPQYGQAPPQGNGYGPPQGQPQYQQPGPPPPAANGAQPLGSPTQLAGSDDSGFFDGASGSPSFSWGKGKGFGEWKGGIYTGVISEKQATDYDTKKPEFWAGGDPKLDVVVELLSPDRDANNPLDDGRRRLFVPKRDTDQPDSMHSVVKEATRGGFHRGGQLWVCKVGTRRGEKNDRIVWAAQYQPPTAETLAILDRMPPQGVSQQGAQSVVQQPQEQTPFVGQPAPQQSGYQPQGQPVQGNGYPPAPNGQQFPSYAGAPAASNQPQWGPSGGPQEQSYPPAAPQGPPQYGPPQGSYGPNGGPPPQYQQPQQGAPAQTANPYAQYQQ